MILRSLVGHGPGSHLGAFPQQLDSDLDSVPPSIIVARRLCGAI